MNQRVGPPNRHTGPEPQSGSGGKQPGERAPQSPAPGGPAAAFEAFPTGLDGLVRLRSRVFRDPRGSFVKTYSAETFAALGLAFAPREEFFSVSARHVLRGMHFQIPPMAHDKLVYCIAGRVLDVALDLRRASPTRGRVHACELSADNREMLFIPVGFAHGFLAMEDQTVMVYQISTVYSPPHDQGILWNSFGFTWPAANPLVSARDSAFPSWQEFDSPF